jgi:hypothetical protein
MTWRKKHDSRRNRSRSSSGVTAWAGELANAIMAAETIRLMYILLRGIRLSLNS